MKKSKQKKMSVEQMEIRKDELEEDALAAFCDDAGYVIDEWLSAEDRIEYQRILFDLGESEYDPDKEEK